MLSGSWRIADLMICVISLDQVLHDGTGLEEMNGFAICEGIRQCRYATIRIDLEKPWLLLLLLGEVNLFCLVR